MFPPVTALVAEQLISDFFSLSIAALALVHRNPAQPSDGDAKVNERWFLSDEELLQST